MDDALTRILGILAEIAEVSPEQLRCVVWLLRDPYVTMREIGERIGKRRETVRDHLHRAAARHPEIGALLRSARRAEVINHRKGKR